MELEFNVICNKCGGSIEIAREESVYALAFFVEPCEKCLGDEYTKALNEYKVKETE